jgi:pyruvate/2-oxoglutarate dehydrogenase complex dihydrolipoamide dehydrogenase (E3) component
MTPSPPLFTRIYSSNRRSSILARRNALIKMDSSELIPADTGPPNIDKAKPISTLNNDQSPSHYDAIVVGSGQGGTPLTLSLAQSGLRTLLIEATHIGGSRSCPLSPPQVPNYNTNIFRHPPACVNEGCTPTKTMVASARVSAMTVRGPDYGVRYKRSSLLLDMEVVRKRKRDIVNSFRSGGEARLSKNDKVEICYGKGKFVGDRRLEIALRDGAGTRVVSADKVFVNVGCRPAPLKAKDADKIEYLNSTSVMELGEVPKRLAVIGGGYVGVEFAQMFRRFGSKVTIVQRGPRVLMNEDEDVSEAVAKILRDDGIEIFTNAETKEVANAASGQIILTLHLQGGGAKSLLVSQVLNAGGRIPNTDDLGVKEAGIELDSRGFIKVDGALETSAEGVWALGDVKGGPQFTHISYDDFRVLEHNLITQRNSKPKSTKDRLVPYTVFMDPQLGRVGHTVASARKAFPDRKLQVAKMPMEWVARALETDETRGFMKAVVDEETKEILGFACLGIDGGEVMSMVQIACMGGLTYEALRDGCFSHPCLSEALNNLWGGLERVE